ncbi:MAG: hypothetical protein RIR56_265 [Bacteroidota bacterium]|jgi:hypothetical protein
MSVKLIFFKKENNPQNNFRHKKNLPFFYQTEDFELKFHHSIYDENCMFLNERFLLT